MKRRTTKSKSRNRLKVYFVYGTIIASIAFLIDQSALLVSTSIHQQDSIPTSETITNGIESSFVLKEWPSFVDSIISTSNTTKTATADYFAEASSSFCQDALQKLIKLGILTNDISVAAPLDVHHLHMIRRICWHQANQKQKEVFVKFTETIWNRQHNKTMYLHIPKSAGSSWCNASKASSSTTSIRVFQERRNCCLTAGNFLELGPRWAGVTPRKGICPVLVDVTLPYDFFMNERFLDYNVGSPFCEGFLYATTLREPLERVWSQIGHQNLRTLNQNQLTTHNYVTWSLAGGEFEKEDDLYPDSVNGRRQKQPSQGWFPRALETLLGFDFITTLEKGKYGCATETMMKMLRIDVGRMQHVNMQKSEPKRHSITDDEIRKANHLDLELWHIIRHLERSECEFLNLLINERATNSRYVETLQ